MGANISIIKLITKPFNHCIDIADDMTCQSKCCGYANSCTCDTKNSRASPISSRDSDATLDNSPKTPSHGSRQRSK